MSSKRFSSRSALRSSLGLLVGSFHAIITVKVGTINQQLHIRLYSPLNLLLVKVSTYFIKEQESNPHKESEMSYPPNSAVVIRRSPQHGIRITKTCSSGPSLSPSSPSPETSHSWPSISTSAHTIICAEAYCNNMIDVVPHYFNTGISGIDSRVYIKARCKECEPPVTVPTWWVGHSKAKQEEQKWDEASSDDWADDF